MLTRLSENPQSGASPRRAYSTQDTTYAYRTSRVVAGRRAGPSVGAAVMAPWETPSASSISHMDAYLFDLQVRVSAVLVIPSVCLSVSVALDAACAAGCYGCWCALLLPSLPHCGSPSSTAVREAAAGGEQKFVGSLVPNVDYSLLRCRASWSSGAR
eukprot:COSAG02_NODE_922_length_15907_cov_4.423303_12_plen_157_part_00